MIVRFFQHLFARVNKLHYICNYFIRNIHMVRFSIIMMNEERYSLNNNTET